MQFRVAALVQECKKVLDELLNLNISFRNATEQQLSLVDALFRYTLQPVQLACLKEIDNPWDAMHQASVQCVSRIAGVRTCPFAPQPSFQEIGTHSERIGMIRGSGGPLNLLLSSLCPRARGAMA